MLRCVYIVFMAAWILGCTKSSSGKAGPAPAQGGQVSLKRMITSKAVPNDLRQIAYFYRLYNTDFNRSPANLEEFKSYIQRDAGKLAESLDKGIYVVIWKVNDLSSNAVLAYENEPDQDGKRYVVKGDASVEKMNEQEWRKAVEGR
jgi:hypothetical protein